MGYTGRLRHAGISAGIGAGLALALALAVASGGCAPESGSHDGTARGGDFVTVNEPVEGEYIAVLAEGALGSEPSLAAAARTLVQDVGADAEIAATYESVLGGFLVEMSEEDAIALSHHERIAYVEENGVRTVAGGTQVDPPSWGLDRTSQRDLPLDGTYEYDATGAGVAMYIIDTGVKTDHEDFGRRAHDGFSAIDDGRGAEDCNGHGTHVAGTAGGAAFGVAKAVDIYPVRVLGCRGSGTTANVIAGVEWVTDHASGPAVANMSLGGGASDALDQAVRDSVAANVTYSLASGNSNTDACNSSPARVEEALTVNSSDDGDRRSSFSNYGECSDLFAPGSGITSAWIGSESATRTISGTSMAAPHVAGVAALYLEANRDADPEEVKTALADNATAGAIADPGDGDTPNLLVYSGFTEGGEPLPAPAVEITAPADGASLEGTTTIAAEAAPDEAPIAEVRFELPDGTTATVESAPYETEWDTSAASDGSRDIVAVARDGDGHEGLDSIQVTINNIGDGEPWAAFAEPGLPTREGEAVCSTAVVDTTGDASNATVDLWGWHDWRSDLRAELSRDGEAQVVFEDGELSSGGGAFSVEGRAVAGFGGDARGEWTLCIEDTSEFDDEGELEEWGVYGES